MLGVDRCGTWRSGVVGRGRFAVNKNEKRRKYCSGCHNNFYNGNNEMGITECWFLEKSEVVRKKFVHIDQRPPWNQKAEWTLNCHRRDRYISVRPEVVR